MGNACSDGCFGMCLPHAFGEGFVAKYRPCKAWQQEGQAATSLQAGMVLHGSVASPVEE